MVPLCPQVKDFSNLIYHQNSAPEHSFDQVLSLNSDIDYVSHL